VSGAFDRRLWGGDGFRAAALVSLSSTVSATTAADLAEISRQDFNKPASSTARKIHQQTAGM